MFQTFIRRCAAKTTGFRVADNASRTSRKENRMPANKKARRETVFTMLKTDHDKVKKLFDKFEKADPSEKKEIASQTLEELKVHASIEEQLLYPALRQE